MKNNNGVKIALLIPFLVIFCWSMYYSNFIRNAKEVVLPISGYDPRNLLSGHYIEFRINWAKADCQQANWHGHCPVEEFRGVNRFYVPERNARQIERLINGQSSVKIVFAYEKGKDPVAKTMLIDGKDWKNYFSK